MNAPSRMSYKDSGIHSQDNSVFYPSTETSHVDVAQEEQYGQSLKPSDAALKRNGSLPHQDSVGGTEEFEMKRRESDSPKKLPPISNPPPVQKQQNNAQTDDQNNKDKSFGNIFDYANEPVSNGKTVTSPGAMNSPGSSVNTETSASPLFNNAHVEFCSSDLQNNAGRLPEAIKEENEKSECVSQQEVGKRTSSREDSRRVTQYTVVYYTNVLYVYHSAGSIEKTLLHDFLEISGKS